MDMQNMNLVRMTHEDLQRLERDFLYTGKPQRFVPLTEADQLEPMNKDQRKAWMRNKPCPCGSSKKFKKCCWSKYAPMRRGGLS